MEKLKEIAFKPKKLKHFLGAIYDSLSWFLQVVDEFLSELTLMW